MTRAAYPFQPIPFTQVMIQDDFWSPRLETNRTMTIPYDFQKCEETGRIDNFVKAAGGMRKPTHRAHLSMIPMYTKSSKVQHTACKFIPIPNWKPTLTTLS